MPPRKAATTSTATPSTSKKGVSPLALARGALSKILQDDTTVPLNDEMLMASLPHITTGSLNLDYLIGGRPNQQGIRPCPGWPRGKISQLYGNAGAGKTTLALTAAAHVCANGGTVCYIDWENEVDPRYAKALGVPIGDPDHFVLEQPTTLEEGMKIMVQMAANGVDLIVLDSVGAGVPQDVYDRDQKEEGNATRPGLLAQKWGQFLPKFKSIIAKSGTCVIGISQLRKTMNSMSGGGPDSAPQGGEGWKFNASVRMMLRVFQKEKSKRFNAITGKAEEMVTGTIVVAKLDKCKVSDSVHHEQKFYLESGTGIDNARAVLDLAVTYGVITKGGAWYEWPGCPKGSLRGQGSDAMKKLLKSDPTYLGLLFNQLSPKLGATPPPAAEVQVEEDVLDDDLFDIIPGSEKSAPAASEDGEGEGA